MTSDEKNPASVTEPSIYEEYIKQLRQWKYECELQKQIWFHHWMLQNLAAHQTALSNVQHQNLHNSNPAQHQVQQSDQLGSQHQAAARPPLFREFGVPSLWRRLAAEVMDFVVLFVLKMGMVWALTNSLGISVADTAFQIMWIDDVNFEDFDQVQQEELEAILLVALLYRGISWLYEWFFLWYRGATPGKAICGLKVVACQVSTGLNQDAVTVIPGSPIGSKSAWIRSLVKNLSIAFMIPSCLTALFHAHRRTSYDVISNTMVVVDGVGVAR